MIKAYAPELTARRISWFKWFACPRCGRVDCVDAPLLAARCFCRNCLLRFRSREPVSQSPR